MLNQSLLLIAVVLIFEFAAVDWSTLNKQRIQELEEEQDKPVFLLGDSVPINLVDIRVNSNGRITDNIDSQFDRLVFDKTKMTLRKQDLTSGFSFYLDYITVLEPTAKPNTTQTSEVAKVDSIQLAFGVNNHYESFLKVRKSQANTNEPMSLTLVANIASTSLDVQELSDSYIVFFYVAALGRSKVYSLHLSELNLESWIKLLKVLQNKAGNINAYYKITSFVEGLRSIIALASKGKAMIDEERQGNNSDKIIK